MPNPYYVPLELLAADGDDIEIADEES